MPANVHDALRFTRRWLPLLILGPLLAALAGYLVVREIPPVYEARVTLLVSPGTTVGNIGADDLRGAEQLARTYAEAIQTRPILEEAAAQVGLTGGADEIGNSIGARLIRDTQLLRITAEDTDPVQAAQIANAVADVFIAKNLEAQAGRFASSRDSLARLVDSLRVDIEARTGQIEALRATPSTPTRDAELARLQSELAQLQTAYGGSVRSYEDLRIAEARGTTTLTLLEPAIVPQDSIRPRVARSVVLAALAGLVAAVVFAAIAEYLDDLLRNARRIGSATGLVTLGSIPETEDLSTRAVVSGRRAESYRLLLLNLQVAGSDQQLRTLMVTSAGIGEGKSLTAANLAAVIAESGQRAILVDADLHRPTQAALFERSNRTGLSTLLLNPKMPAVDALQPTVVPNLRLLAAGGTPADPAALFSSRRLEGRIAELSELCDVVVFDTPPLLAQPDAALLGSHLDAALFVVDATQSRGRPAARAVQTLRQSGAPVLGAVLNRIPKKGLEYGGYRYGYGAYGTDEGKPEPRPGPNGHDGASPPPPAGVADRTPVADAAEPVVVAGRLTEAAVGLLAAPVSPMTGSAQQASIEDRRGGDRPANGVATPLAARVRQPTRPRRPRRGRLRPARSGDRGHRQAAPADHPSSGERGLVIVAGTTSAAFPPRSSVAGILVSHATYAGATASILRAARAGLSTLVAATSVHGLTLGALNRSFGAQLNRFDMVTPDGQPVRWALNLLHDAGLTHRVYGPTLMLRVCEAAAREGIAVYCYGSRSPVLTRLVRRLSAELPTLRIAGYRSPPFRPTTPEEDAADVRDILQSGARIVFVGLGCPRQEQWAYAHRDRLPMPLVCVGAAFDFHAGTLRQAPAWMQAGGLEWLFRLAIEPRRLWRRYAKHIPIFILLVGRQYLADRLRHHATAPAGAGAPAGR